MKISIKWVLELIDIESVSLDYLIEKLTLGGFEVEEVLEVDINDEKIITLDISATANRSDSLSILGISKEIAALLDKSTKLSPYLIKNFNWKEQLKTLSHETKNGFTFIALTVENLENLSAPEWLKQKLIALGITVENNLCDFQNYILLETGYPFEFYDLDKIHSKCNNDNFDISLTTSKVDELFITNDNTTYKLDESVSLIRAGKVPISIAGISSSKDTFYSNDTKSLLIEASIFNSAKIRQQSRVLGLRTDRSSKYEKSLKNINLLESCYRLISLLRISNPNLHCKLHTFSTFSQNTLNNSAILLKDSNIKKILGPINKSKTGDYEYISTELVAHYLDRLNFEYEYLSDDTDLMWKVNIPYLRSEDIISEIDLIEEIGRLHGFNKFLSQLPQIKTIGQEDSSYQTRKKLISCFTNLGFNELMHYSLVNEKTYMNNETKLVNPLLKDCSNLRASLLPNLIKTVEENLKKSNISIEGFEYGHVFSGNNPEMIQEKESIAGIFGGVNIKSSWADLTESLNWFEAKGKLEQLFEQLNIITYWRSYTPISNTTIFHPYYSAQIYLSNGVSLGIFGQIHPRLAKTINISPNLYLFEFDFTLIQNQLQKNKLSIYHEYSIYPKIVKDLSFIISNDISFNTVKEMLYFNGSQFLIKVNLLDEYRGQSIPENHTSLCLQLIFQSNEKTLQTKEVENIVDYLKLLLVTNFKAKLR